ncbi:NEK7 [Symbiodinium pilosum]|uniref:NEK7 protein n=1 Tax=Symbiodinium pilosum TaxID=2952 RepID=A0A812QU32_SYMPI|nr:NEK7 [Symbiodinium pilosum]
MCSELQKAQPLTFHKLSGVPALPGFQENELRAFSDCDKKLEIVNQTVSQTNMKDFRSNICDTFCETSEEPMCEPECLDRVLGFMVFPKTLLLQVMEESAAGKSSHEATTNHETII